MICRISGKKSRFLSLSCLLRSLDAIHFRRFFSSSNTALRGELSPPPSSGTLERHEICMRFRPLSRKITSLMAIGFPLFTCPRRRNTFISRTRSEMKIPGISPFCPGQIVYHIISKIGHLRLRSHLFFTSKKGFTLVFAPSADV